MSTAESVFMVIGTAVTYIIGFLGGWRTAIAAQKKENEDAEH